jgi:rubrerythrin
MEQYAALAAEMPAGPVQELFRFLAQKELRHKGELERRYYDLVYSTNV